MPDHTRIINVFRKPKKCPVCGESVVDIIYGTGDMTESDFLLKYRKPAIMGGDIIPRRPPIWECSCGCKRFRKVNPDGTDAPVRVKLLKDVRPGPAGKIIWSSNEIQNALRNGQGKRIHYYTVNVETNVGEKESLRISALSDKCAAITANNLLNEGLLFLKGIYFTSVEVIEDDNK